MRASREAGLTLEALSLSNNCLNLLVISSVLALSAGLRALASFAASICVDSALMTNPASPVGAGAAGALRGAGLVGGSCDGGGGAAACGTGAGPVVGGPGVNTWGAGTGDPVALGGAVTGDCAGIGAGVKVEYPVVVGGGAEVVVVVLGPLGLNTVGGGGTEAVWDGGVLAEAIGLPWVGAKLLLLG